LDALLSVPSPGRKQRRRVGFSLANSGLEPIKMGDLTLYTMAVVLMSAASVLTGARAALWML